MSGLVVLVASPGGHIDQAYEIADRFADPANRLWITARTPQTQALLDGERVEWVRAVWSREALGAIRSLPGALRILREYRPRLVVSTGSALAVPYMAAARMLRTPVTYVESATRHDAPSMTGRITEWMPRVERRYQSTGWTRRDWKPFGSIFDAYTAVPRPPREVRNILVTLGSEKFPFERAVRGVLEACNGFEVVWQTGNTPLTDTELHHRAVRAWWPGDELAAQARIADVVVSHAGVGSILMVLRAGSCPVVVPRLSRLGEHVDDHQVELSRVLEERGLVVVAHPNDDIGACIQEAAKRSIVRATPALPPDAPLLGTPHRPA